MNKAVKDLTFAIAYLDDIIIYSKTTEEHVYHQQQVFHKCCDTELSMKLSKCHKNAKQVRAFLGLVGYYCTFTKNFVWLAKSITALIHHDVKFAWTTGHHAAFNTLKSALLEAPILHYKDPSKCYIVYTDASNDTCGAQLSQENDGHEMPIEFLFHMFTDTQQKCITTKQDAYGINYAVTKWNYY